MRSTEGERQLRSVRSSTLRSTSLKSVTAISVSGVELDAMAASTPATSVAGMLSQLTSVLRGTPVGRLCSLLKRLRSSKAPFTAQADKAVQEADSSAHYTHRPLLPMHLPKWRQVDPTQGRHHRRSTRTCRLAELWSDWVIVVINYLSMGGPKSEHDVSLALGVYHVTGEQQLAAEAIRAELVSFCSLKPNLQLGQGRGLQKVFNVLSKLGASPAREKFSPGDALKEALDVAIDIDPDRIALADPAGQCQPEKFLSRSQAAEINDLPGLLLPPPRLGECMRPCYKVPKHVELDLRRKMLDTGTAIPIPESLIERRSDGKLLLAGLFAVYHSELKDRLILDRRPANAGERRIVWSKMPYGPMLGMIQLHDDLHVRGSGDDLDTYFSRLRQADALLPRCAFGRRFDGREERARGCIPGVNYRMALVVWAMGGHNSSDVAQTVHEGVLRAAGGLTPQEKLTYGHPLPTMDPKTGEGAMEGAYQDDHLVLGIVHKSNVMRLQGRDRDLIDFSHAGYQDAGLPKSQKKAFGLAAFRDGQRQPGERNFVAWGTEIKSDPGTAGAPQQKVMDICAVSLFYGSFRFVQKSLLRRIVALQQHPLQHRKETTCIHNRVFKFIEDLPESGGVRWPADILDEVMGAVILLPLCTSHMRWEVSPTISSTDATPQAGGSTRTLVSQLFAQHLFQCTEYRGKYVRLDEANGGVEFAHSAVIDELSDSLQWEVCAQHALPTRHVNLQETFQVGHRTKQLCEETLLASKHVNFVDSNVALGCWAKGRSSAFTLNAILRPFLGWKILGRKWLANLKIDTKHNTGDDPSRFVKLRDRPRPPPSWVKERTRAEDCVARASCSSYVPDSNSGVRFREAYAGMGGLSSAFAKHDKAHVSRPIEPVHISKLHHPSGTNASDIRLRCKGVGCKYVSFLDLDDMQTQRTLELEIRSNFYKYVHFGIPCKSWGSLSRINGGTRSKFYPQGSGQLERELLGNRQADFVARMCRLLAQQGNYFSIENPKGSYLFLYQAILSLNDLPSVFTVHFDQCAFGHKLPGAPPHTFCRKSTSVLTNLECLKHLECRCPGISRFHRHEHAWGSRKVQGRRISLAAAAGAYPPTLCERWASVVVSAWEGGAL